MSFLGLLTDLLREHNIWYLEDIITFCIIHIKVLDKKFKKYPYSMIKYHVLQCFTGNMKPKQCFTLLKIRLVSMNLSSNFMVRMFYQKLEII